MTESARIYKELLDGYTLPEDKDFSLDKASKREKAVMAALSLLHAHASGGTGSVSIHNYKGEIGPLADAIQEALVIETN